MATAHMAGLRKILRPQLQWHLQQLQSYRAVFLGLDISRRSTGIAAVCADGELRSSARS